MSPIFQITLDPASSVPIFQQIVQGIERAILTGSLADGVFLPSVRDFAVAHAVNPNTVSRAYQLVQSQGLAEPVRGLGLRARAPDSPRARERVGEILDAKIGELVQVANALGISAEELGARVGRCLREAKSGSGGTNE